jgi:hypothetical protein
MTVKRVSKIENLGDGWNIAVDGLRGKIAKNKILRLVEGKVLNWMIFWSWKGVWRLNLYSSQRHIQTHIGRAIIMNKADLL